MRFRPLPFETTLRNIAAEPKDGQERALQLREGAFLETARTQGFQLLTVLLRDLEAAALNALRAGSGNIDRLVGRLQCIEEIRRSLVALLPDDQRTQVDWHDDPLEDFVLLDAAPSTPPTESTVPFDE